MNRLLLLYSDYFSYEFHRAVFIEMLRITAEVRVFPLRAFVLKLFPYFPPLLEDFAPDHDGREPRLTFFSLHQPNRVTRWAGLKSGLIHRQIGHQ